MYAASRGQRLYIPSVELVLAEQYVKLRWISLPFVDYIVLTWEKIPDSHCLSILQAMKWGVGPGNEAMPTIQAYLYPIILQNHHKWNEARHSAELHHEGSTSLVALMRGKRHGHPTMGTKHWGCKTQYQKLLWTVPSQLTQEERHRRHTMGMNTEVQTLYHGLLLTYQVSSCRCVCIITRHVIQGHIIHQVKAFQFLPLAQATAYSSSWSTRHGHVTMTMRSRVGPLSHLEWVESLSRVSNIQLGLWAIQSGWGHWVVHLIYKWAP